MEVELDVLMDKYEQQFGDIFPTMCFQTDSDEELKRKIEKCLKQNESAEELFDLDYNNLY